MATDSSTPQPAVPTAVPAEPASAVPGEPASAVPADAAPAVPAELVYRAALATDADAVMAFWATAAEDDQRPPDSSAAVLRLLERDPEALILAFDNDQVVGSIIVGWDGWRCHLYRLAVAPTHRRRGIARTLINLAETRFTTYGGTRADAMVLDTNTTAHPTWTKAGYTRQPTWSRWVKPL